MGATPDQPRAGELHRFLDELEHRNPHEPQFRRTVAEVARTVMPHVLGDPAYREARVLDRLTEPDRVITFRVVWEDDSGEVRVNRAWRVQFSNAIGPYKGGLRLHPEVDLSVLKSLGFEQCFKNALTGLPMGGAKGGADFDPKGKSDRAVMRFCQAMMRELHRHIGEGVDVPAGDIGVGTREIGYLFGQYRALHSRFGGVLTGKDLSFGGSPVRSEATGYGAVYFAQRMLEASGKSLDGMRCALSGAGNVALYAARKLDELGARVVTLSDSEGTVYEPDGIGGEKLDFVTELKLTRRGRLREYADAAGARYLEAERPWSAECDAAFPCATQNELDGSDAAALVQQGCKLVVEGANMPCTHAAIERFADAEVLFAPGKAANAGGVAVSGLEQSQNASGTPWSAAEVDRHLRRIMADIHDTCLHYGDDGSGRVDYLAGANLGGFVKLADAVLAQGLV